MAVTHLSEMTWEEVRDCDKSQLALILPIGATEAHGPHLPLGTDVIIAEAMAREGVRQLAEAGQAARVLPPLAYTSAGFASGFAGTISVRPATVQALIEDVAAAVAKQGFRWLVCANAHLDPDHIGAIRGAVESINAGSGALHALFPDVTRKPWALRLTDEFKSGACHAGCYEGSIVMAERPDLVRESLRTTLPDNPSSLSVAIRDGKRSFEEAGGPRAYFGQPAAASSNEGTETVRILGGIVRDAVQQALSAGG